MTSREVNISVRQMIEFVLRSGDIKTVFLSSGRAVDGIKAHQKIQKKFAKELNAYEPEVTISDVVVMDKLVLKVSGRIDGIIKDYDMPIIDEIKSVTRDLSTLQEDYNPLHWAQGKMYAYMYGKSEGYKQIIVQLTYANNKGTAIKQFQRSYEFVELEDFFMDTVIKYAVFLKKTMAYQVLKKESIKQLAFPFPEYRKGQKQLMASVYKVIMEDEKLFARAPTGIGKTMAILFPAIKSLSKHEGKLFYLTAKTIGREVANKALEQLEKEGLMLKRITLTAKEKLCLNDEKRCDGKYCPYAKGHYDRINKALLALIDERDCYDRDILLAYAQEYRVCPYELALDMTYFCDCIICDYNYAFDPSAVLKRYFSEDTKKNFLGDESKPVFLIDEAHNLVDRGREMYSGCLSKKVILDMKKRVKERDKTLYRYLNKMNKYMIDKRYDCEENGFIIEKMYSDEFVDLIRGVLYRTEKIFSGLVEWEHTDKLLEFYFEAYDFMKKVDLYDERYVTYYEKISDELKMKLFCIDPSFNLKSYMTNAKAVVLFSATLTPMDYFVKILGGDEKSYGLQLESPFDAGKLCLLINNQISTKYKDRVNTYEQVAKTIKYTMSGKKGNYMVFFPSYKYMEEVYGIFLEMIDVSSIVVMKQERGLTEQEKEVFLEAFEEERDHSLVAFAVLGGMFGEGIDLKGEKLSGAIIVGVGLPSICLERDIIKGYYNQQSNKGFQYAYMYPGMNKVMQAAGRVIRTEDDEGVVVLVDERFGFSDYRELFPKEWQHRRYFKDFFEIRDAIRTFFTE
jgi:DNA excision repair protein ERCC-2